MCKYLDDDDNDDDDNDDRCIFSNSGLKSAMVLEKNLSVDTVAY